MRLSDTGRCGACKAPLAPVNHPIDADSAGFDDIVRTAKVPVLADFWASWCGPCKMVSPEVNKLAADMSGRVIVIKVDTETNPHLAARYSIQSIPNFVVFRDGRPVFQHAGVASSVQMRGWIEQSNRAPKGY